MITNPYSPNISVDANGYPVSPGFASMRTKEGTLDPRFAVTAPKLSDFSQWKTLQDKGLAQESLVGMDTARQKGATVAPAQGGGSLNSGARGIAALQGMGQNQAGVAGQAMSDTNKMMDVNDQYLQKQFGQQRAQTGLDMSAAGANQAALQKDLDASNQFQLAEYQNALMRQQGIDMKNAAGGGGSAGGGGIVDTIKDTLGGKSLSGAAGLAFLGGPTLPLAIAAGKEIDKKVPNGVASLLTGSVAPTVFTGANPNVAAPIAQGVASLNSLLPGGGSKGVGFGALSPEDQAALIKAKERMDARNQPKKQVSAAPAYDPTDISQFL